MMRLAILSGLLLFAVGGSGTYFITAAADGHDAPFSARYTALVAREPETVYRHLDEAMADCAPATAGLDAPARRLMIEAFAVSVQMRSDGRSEDAILRTIEGLAGSGDFAALKRTGVIATILRDDKRTCILSQAKRGLIRHLAARNADWNLRR